MSQDKLIFQLNANSKRFIPAIIAIWFAAAIFLVIPVSMFSAGGLGQRNSGPGLLMGAIGLGFVGWAIYMTVITYQKRHDQVRVMNDRLIATQKGVERTVYWKDIKYFWQDVTILKRGRRETGRRHQFRIQLNDKTVLVFDDYLKGVARLGNVLQQTITPHLLLEAEQTLLRGETVSFGDVSITPEGIKFDVLLPWAEVKAIDIKQGYLVVDKKDGSKFRYWKRKKVAEIPNIAILITLAKKRVKG